MSPPYSIGRAARSVSGTDCYRLTNEPKKLIHTPERGTAQGAECAAGNYSIPLQWSTTVFGIVQ